MRLLRSSTRRPRAPEGELQMTREEALKGASIDAYDAEVARINKEHQA